MTGKTFFVTGGNTGIGFETARAFARAGANVAILSLGEERNAEARAEIEALGVQCLAMTGDVTREDAVRDAITRTCDRFGGLDYAFNNAGIGQAMSHIWDQDEAEYERLMAIDVKGVWLALKYEIPAMMRSGGGAIVNAASAAGVKGVPKQVLYCAAKHAVVGLTRGAALDHAGDGIRVNAIAPGVVNTEMIRAYADANRADWEGVLAMHPMGVVAEPGEVAAAVLFLCRDATKTTGMVLTIDSGLCL